MPPVCVLQVVYPGMPPWVGEGVRVNVVNVLPWSEGERVNVVNVLPWAMRRAFLSTFPFHCWPVIPAMVR